jgi:hypothetical protein
MSNTAGTTATENESLLTVGEISSAEAATYSRSSPSSNINHWFYSIEN